MTRETTKSVATMNIKNPEAHALAREISVITGESLTAAVVESLRERRDRLRRRSERGLSERLLEIGRQAAVHFKEPYEDPSDFLYDELGLPIDADHARDG